MMKVLTHAYVKDAIGNTLLRDGMTIEGAISYMEEVIRVLGSENLSGLLRNHVTFSAGEVEDEEGNYYEHFEARLEGRYWVDGQLHVFGGGYIINFSAMLMELRDYAVS